MTMIANPSGNVADLEALRAVAEAADLLNNDPEPTDADWDRWAEDAHLLDLHCSGVSAF